MISLVIGHFNFRRCQLGSPLVSPLCSPYQHRWDHFLFLLSFPSFPFCLIFSSLLDTLSTLVRPNQTASYSSVISFSFHQKVESVLTFFIFSLLTFTYPSLTWKVIVLSFSFLQNSECFIAFSFLQSFPWFTWMLICRFFIWNIFPLFYIFLWSGKEDHCLLPLMNFSIKTHIARFSNDHCNCLAGWGGEAFQLCVHLQNIPRKISLQNIPCKIFLAACVCH